MNVERRVGIGYDVHRLSAVRTLVLGGIEIPDYPGLEGHSDADVLTHAVMDALLGAGGLGDIGQHFPDDDPRYADANSIELLAAVNSLLAREKWRVVNVDSTVVCEVPRLAPFAASMRDRIGGALGIDAARVGVKATTNERLGFIGRGEAIAAHAVAQIERGG